MNRNTLQRKFFALLRNAGIDKDGRAELIYNFTKGKKTSTKELTIKQLSEIVKYLEKMLGKTDEIDKNRKRVIAVIYDHEGQNKSLEYIKAIASRSGGVEDFNKIPLSKLRAIYNEYLNKNKVKQNIAVEDFCKTIAKHPLGEV